MFKRWQVIVGSLVVVVAVALGGWLLFRPTYDDVVEDCIAAIEERPKGDRSKPEACDGVKEDDYSLIDFHEHLDDQGVWNEDGSVNLENLLEDPDDQP
ncbi:hypothetical protein [Streptomyces sp. NPDC052012]|uniref:hypothetical protein n=1 Tax=Streptomyces sp. NPDC052012 TaxID=3155051 RepID=UPI00344D51D1